MTLQRGYYDFLGVAPSADEETLHQAFRRLSKDLHPDTTTLPLDEAARKFQYLCEAYELLTDKQRRKEYDAALYLDSSAYGKNMEGFVGFSNKPFPKKYNQGIRRPFSGGELFSLLLLFLAFIVSLCLGLLVAYSQGRELLVKPSWLNIEMIIVDTYQSSIREISIVTRDNSHNLPSGFLGNRS